jgi:hypothetical protein
MTTDTAFDRLRRANPCPAATTADAESLFERITSTAPDARSRRRPRTYRRAALVLAVVAALVAVLASAAPAISNWIGDVIGKTEVTSEYADAQSKLTLPPGYAWPDQNFPANAVTSRGAGGSFAVFAAQGAWECYWVKAIRDGNVAGGRRARLALRDLMTRHIVVAPSGASENWSPPQSEHTPTAAFADDGGYELKQKMYAEAAAGRPQLLEQSCRANGPPR